MLGTCAHSFAAHEASAITSGERTIGRMACLGAGECKGEPDERCWWQLLSPVRGSVVVNGESSIG